MLLKFKDLTGNEEHWINPDNISSAKHGKRKKDNVEYTVLHMNSTSQPTIFIKEKPEELNKIFAKFAKRNFKVVEE